MMMMMMMMMMTTTMNGAITRTQPLPVYTPYDESYNRFLVMLLTL